MYGTIASIALCALMLASPMVAIGEESTYPPHWEDVVAKISTSIALRDDPLYSFGGTESELSAEDLALFRGPAREVAEWSVNYNRCLLSLIEGNSAAFRDLLRSLEVAFEDGSVERSLASRALKVAMLYAWAVEAGVGGLDPVRFERVLGWIDQADQSPYSQFVKISYAFLARDQQLLQRSISESGFVSAYAHLLVYRLDPTPANLQNAIGRLTNELSSQQKSDPEATGRVALHLSELYREKFRISRSRSDLEESLRVARVARTHLETLSMPLFNKAAHQQTAESLEAMYEEKGEADQFDHARLAARIERARELSLM